jgi:hypothetical protein
VRDVPQQAAPSLAPIQLGTPAPEPRSAVEARRLEPRRVVEPRPLAEPRRIVVEPRPVAEPRRIVEPVRPAQAQRASEPRYIEPRATEPATTHRSRRRKARRALRIALAAAVFIACAHLAVSGASSVSSTTASRTRTPRQLIEAPAEALKDLTPRTVAAVMPVLQSIPLPSMQPATPEPPAAVKKAAVTTTGFPRRAPIASPAPAPVVVDSAPSPDIAAAPDAGPVAGPELPQVESLTPQVGDSSGKIRFKRLLRTISGTPAPGRKPAKP